MDEIQSETAPPPSPAEVEAQNRSTRRILDAWWRSQSQGGSLANVREKEAPEASPGGVAPAGWAGDSLDELAPRLVGTNVLTTRAGGRRVRACYRRLG